MLHVVFVHCADNCKRGRKCVCVVCCLTARHLFTSSLFKRWNNSNRNVVQICLLLLIGQSHSWGSAYLIIVDLSAGRWGSGLPWESVWRDGEGEGWRKSASANNAVLLPWGRQMIRWSVLSSFCCNSCDLKQFFIRPPVNNSSQWT